MIGRSVIIIFLSVMGWTSLASGHPLIEEARQQFQSADFTGAIDLLTQAEEASDLTRKDVIELVELMAIVNAALDNTIALSQNLRALASLDPGHQFPPEATPILVAQFDTIQAEPMTLDVNVVQEGSDVSIQVEVLHDQGNLIRNVVLQGSDGSSSQWNRSENQHILIEGTSENNVEWTVEAFGPGQAALLARASSPDVDRSRFILGEFVGNGSSQNELPDDIPPAVEVEDPDDSSMSRRRRRWPIWLSVGLVSAVIVAVVVGVSVSNNNDRSDYTEVVGPFVGGN